MSYSEWVGWILIEFIAPTAILLLTVMLILAIGCLVFGIVADVLRK